MDYFIPENYNLHLNINKKQRQFNGTVIVTGQPQAKEIRFHAKDLTISSVCLDGEETEKWQLVDDEVIIKGRAEQITINFAGQISETAMNGLYLCKYQLNGQNRELFATQFESHYARQCFPCIDEPAAKATFDITITTDDPDDKIILSNMPGHKDGNTWRFDTTPRMSTYLVAFVGGNLISKSGYTQRGVEINTYATPAQPAESLDYALDTAIKSVEFYEDYFGVNYPLPKLDNVALPDFSAGAMENWGLITYRETAMLATNDTAEDSREQIATVIAHEISHQWFGNLVTMQWWNDLWLNESFASLMENTTTDYIYPHYRIWDDFESGDVFAALRRDALPGVQSVQQEVSDPDEIATLFDGAIVYAKGERLIKMLRAVIGETAFRHGLTNYFNRHKYGNTIASDLWDALSDTSNTDVAQLMTPWLTQPNYPVITVSLNDDLLTLRQDEFHTDGSSNPDKVWPIPLFANVAELPQIMTDKEISVKLSNPQQLVQLNLGNQAHFIVKYDSALLQRLADNFHNLDITDKIKLLHESLLLSLSGKQDIRQIITLLRSAQNETNQAVLASISGLIGNLSILATPNSVEEKQLKKLANQLFSQQFARLFGDSDSHYDINDRKSLAVVLSRSVYGENQSAVDYCLDIYNKNAKDLSAIPGDIRSAVLGCAVKFDNDAFTDLWQAYRVTQNAELKLDICAGLTATRDNGQINALLSNLTDTAQIKPQDNIYFVIWLLSNPYARTSTWRWIRNNWKWIDEVFSGDMGYDDYVRATSNNLRTADELAEYDTFFGNVVKNSPALERSVEVGHTAIVNRIKWIKDNRIYLHNL